MAKLSVPAVLRWTGRVGKLGLMATLAMAIGSDMLLKTLGSPVNEKALVAGAMPFVIAFAILAAGGDIASRIVTGAMKG